MANTLTVTASQAMAPNVPSLKLCRRTRVKDLINVARTDPKFDHLLDGLIAQFSQQVQHYLQRILTYGQYTEFHQSYDQDIRAEIIHEDPQYIFPHAAPIDIGQPIDLRFSFNRDWDNSTALVKDMDFFLDQSFDEQNSLIRIFPERLFTTQSFFPLVTRFRSIHYHPIGFRITYYGGFKVVSPGGDCLNSDETFLDVPEGLQEYVAMKVAMHFMDRKLPLRIASDDDVILEPYKRHGNTLGR